MTNKKPTPPKGMYFRPSEPVAPSELIPPGKPFTSIQIYTNSFYELKDIIDQYGSNIKIHLSNWDYDYYSHENNLESITLSIYSNEPVENPRYEVEFARYEKLLAKYEEDKKLWDEYEAALKKWEAAKRIADEKKLLRQLKQKYEAQ